MWISRVIHYIQSIKVCLCIALQSVHCQGELNNSINPESICDCDTSLYVFKGKHILAQEHEVSRDWTLFIEILFRAAHNQHVEWKKVAIGRHLSYCWISVREVSGQNVKWHVLQTAFKYSIFQSECTDYFSGHHGVFNPCDILVSWPFTLTTLTSYTCPTMHHKQRRSECLVFLHCFFIHVMHTVCIMRTGLHVFISL